MNKEEIRVLLGQLIFVQAELEKMTNSGFTWEKLQLAKDNLRLIIIDLEKALD